MMEELKPCPFCGGKARIIADDPFDGYQGNCTVYLARCVVCGAEISGGKHEKAIEAWNRRTDDGN